MADHLPDDIDGVVAALDAIVERARDEASAVGYFAALYRTVTVRVRDDLARGVFADPARLERLDVAFANRYLAAVAAWRDGARPTRSWEVALEAASGRGPIVLQHLLLGINAHINLDLGIAAATVAPGDALPDLRADFDAINDVLAALTDDARGHLREISPWLGLVDGAGGHLDDEVVRFSITVARAQAWRFATELAPLDPATWATPIALRDTRVAGLAGTVLRPGALTFAVRLVALRESRDVRRNLAVLGA